eukprot:tig00001095_g7038.t1
MASRAGGPAADGANPPLKPYISKAKRAAAAAEAAAQAASSSAESAPSANPAAALAPPPTTAAASSSAPSESSSRPAPRAANAAAASPADQEKLSGTVLSIREKLAGKKAKQRDPNLLAQIKDPVYISHHVARGISPEEAKAALAKHTKHLVGLRYHLATKAEELRRKEKERRERR